MRNIKNRRGLSLVEMVIAIGISAMIMLSFALIFEAIFGKAANNQEIINKNEKAFVESSVMKNLMDEAQYMVYPRNANFNSGLIIFKNDASAPTAFTLLTQTNVNVNLNGTVTPERRIAIRYRNSLANSNLNQASGFSIDTLHQQIKQGSSVVMNGEGIPGKGTDTVSAASDTKLLFPSQIVAGAGGVYFVSDTGNHKIRKLWQESGSWKSQTVLGFDGAASACNGNVNDSFPSHVCGLSFPTGLYYDAPGNALYVADSANNRILKLSDPVSTNTNPLEAAFKVPFDMDIHALSFDFPSGMTLPTGITTTVNINPGVLQATGSRLDYNLYSALNANAPVSLPQGNTNAPNNRLVVRNLTPFAAGNSISVNSNTNSYLISAVDAASLTLTVTPSLSRSYASGEEISLRSKHRKGDLVKVQFSGNTGTPGAGVAPVIRLTVTTVNQETFTVALPVIRPDGVVGSSDDMVTIVQKDLKFPVAITSAAAYVQELSNPATLAVNHLATNFDFVGSLALSNTAPLRFFYDSTSGIVSFVVRFLTESAGEERIKGFTNSALIPMYP